MLSCELFDYCVSYADDYFRRTGKNLYFCELCDGLRNSTKPEELFIWFELIEQCDVLCAIADYLESRVSLNL